MKPIKLVMEAFGSYGARTTIDFTQPGQNLFLITGDTGAGKSTIFDAIVFALYGKASSAENEKKGEILRSQYAPLGVEPFVMLVFSEGEDTYTIKRIPAYRKLREKGEGKGTLKDKAETEKVSLFLPNGQEYANGIEETNKKIEELTGLTRAQFMQIAMIAQGEFMKILRAESKQKKEIFRKLFHTEIFEKIVRELENRKSEKGKVLERMKTECRMIVSGAAIPKDCENEACLKEIKEQITDGSLANMDQFIAELGTLCKRLEEERNSLGEHVQKAEEQREHAREAYTRAEGIVKYFTQLENAEDTLRECERISGAIKQKETLIRDIRSAYEIQALFLRYEEAEKKAKETALNIEHKKAVLPKLTAAASDAEDAEKRAKTALETEQGGLNRIQERVAEAKKTFDKIRLAKEALQKSKAALEVAAKAETDARKSLENLKIKEMNWKERARELGNAEAAYEAWKGKNAELERIGADVESLKKQKAELSQCEVRKRKAQADFAKAAGAYEAKNEEYQMWNRRYMASKAKYFLDRLEDGKPCPICGATQHPNPCRIAADTGDISEERLEELKNAAQQLNKAQLEFAGRSNAAAAAWGEKKKSFDESFAKLRHCESLKAHSGAAEQEITDETVLDIFKRWKAAVLKEGTRLEKNRMQQKEIENALFDAAEEKEWLGETIERHHQAAGAANTDLKSCEREIESLTKGLQYASEKDAENDLQAAKEKYDEKKHEYDKAAKDALKTAKDKTEMETSIRQYEQELPKLTADTAEKKEAYVTAMQEKDLSEAEWEEIVKKHRKDEPDQLQKEVQKYGEKSASAKSLKDAAEKAVAGKARPDLDALKQAQETAQEVYRNARETYDTVRTLCQDNQKVYEQLKPRNRECTAFASEYNQLEKLYKLFSGTVSGGRMDLETYVQRYYLEQILYAANKRFQSMSAGQFELRMTDLEKAGEGKNKGLDLMVYSTVTGKTREIRTLSGGESFMAALALSLGMADQIQQSAAALNLDIMFIDEGFGSLDEHSRSQAVKVLKEMAGGARLVGIISHVTELKQEIDNQLLVSRDETGSHIKWQTS